MYEIGKLVARIHEASHKWLMSELASIGLKSLAPSHGDILVYLFEHGEATMHELAQFAHRTKSTMTVLVDKMVQLDIVTKEKSTLDSRSQIVRLTKYGESLQGAFNDISRRYIAFMYSGVCDKDAIAVERTLSKILSNVQKENTE